MSCDLRKWRTSKSVLFDAFKISLYLGKRLFYRMPFEPLFDLPPHTALSKSKMNGLKRNTLSNWLYVHLGIPVRNAIARRVLEGHDLSDVET
mgnify:CR=1 FL=1